MARRNKFVIVDNPLLEIKCNYAILKENNAFYSKLYELVQKISKYSIL